MIDLHKAAIEGRLEHVRNLIRAGVEVNARDENGRTPLHHSADRNNVPITTALIAAGADVCARDKYGETPLHHSAYRNNIHITTALIAAGADVCARDKYGETPLHLSADNNDVHITTALIAAGADVCARDENGRTPLHSSAQKNYVCITTALISAGADVIAKDAHEKTPLDLMNIFDQEKGLWKFLIKYKLLYSHKLSKPYLEYDVQEVWNKCEEEVKKLKETLLGNSCISVFKFLTETDENKLALYSSVENFGLINTLKRTSNCEMFPMYSEDIEAQFMKGSERARLLLKSQKSIKYFLFKLLPVDCIRQISEYLSNDDLGNLLMSLEFNKNTCFS